MGKFLRMIRNYNEFNIEVIPDSFNLKEHNGYENAIFLTSKGTKTNKKKQNGTQTKLFEYGLSTLQWKRN